MSLKKNESEIKHLAHSDRKVYSVLSDFNNLKKLAAIFEDEEKRGQMVSQFGEEKVRKLQEALAGMEITSDSASFNAPMVGKATLEIVEREEPKLIKLEAKGLPVKACVWVQILPEGDSRCKMKVTTGVEVNFLIKGMVDKYLEPGVNQLAGVLAALPYDKI
mgnify:FL=1